jgi:hypothetical protein
LEGLSILGDLSKLGTSMLATGFGALKSKDYSSYHL